MKLFLWLILSFIWWSPGRYRRDLMCLWIELVVCFLRRDISSLKKFYARKQLAVEGAIAGSMLCLLWACSKRDKSRCSVDGQSWITKHRRYWLSEKNAGSSQKCVDSREKHGRVFKTKTCFRYSWHTPILNVSRDKINFGRDYAGVESLLTLFSRRKAASRSHIRDCKVSLSRKMFTL